MRATLTFNGIIIAQCLVEDHMIANNLDMVMNCFCRIADRRKAFIPYFQPGPMSEVLTIANL